LITIDDVCYLLLYFVVVYFVLSFFLIFSENISPSIKGFKLKSSFVKSGSFSHLKFNHFLAFFVLVKKRKWSRQIPSDFDTLVKFSDVIRHQLDLHGFSFNIRCKINELIFSLQKFLMLLFIHGQVFLSIAFDRVFLILDHAFFHTHKLTYSISLKGVQQSLKSISEMLGVFVNNLRHNFSFLLWHLVTCSLSLYIR